MPTGSIKPGGRQCKRISKRTGEQCSKPALSGYEYCYRHCPNPTARKRSELIEEVQNWRVGTPIVDPVDSMLRVLSITSYRQHYYSKLLSRQMNWDNPDAEVEDEIRGLVGHKFAITKDGTPVPIEESVRALVELERKERELVAHFSEKCIRAGLNERMVKIAEQQAALMFGAIQSILSKLDLDERQQTIAGEIVVAELEQLANGGNMPDVSAEVLENAEVVQ